MAGVSLRSHEESGRLGEVLVTSAQTRAARGLLDWTVRDLAERSGVHRDMVSKIKTGAYAGAPAALEAIRRTLTSGGSGRCETENAMTGAWGRLHVEVLEFANTRDSIRGRSTVRVQADAPVL